MDLKWLLRTNSPQAPEMVINNLGLNQNASTTFMLSLDKSMGKFPNLKLYNIVLQDVSSYLIKTHLGSPSLYQVKHVSLLQDFLEPFICMQVIYYHNNAK